MEINSVLVRNKGFPITMAKVEPVDLSDPPRWRKVVKDEETGDPVTRMVWVRFDGNTVADVEEKYGSVADYQRAITRAPNATMRTVLGMILGKPEREVGEAMLAEQFGDYLLCLQMAWSVAMGMDPTHAAKALAKARREMARKDAAQAAAIEEYDEDADDNEVLILPSRSPEANGKGPGSEPEVILDSSDMEHG